MLIWYKFPISSLYIESKLDTWQAMKRTSMNKPRLSSMKLIWIIPDWTLWSLRPMVTVSRWRQSKHWCKGSRSLLKKKIHKLLGWQLTLSINIVKAIEIKLIHHCYSQKLSNPVTRTTVYCAEGCMLKSNLWQYFINIMLKITLRWIMDKSQMNLTKLNK